MKRILLLFTSLILFFNSYGQSQMDIWKKSNKSALRSGTFTSPKSFASKSPSGKNLIYEKVDHPDIEVETSTGKKSKYRPIVYKSKTDLSVLTYDGKNWAGTHTEDGYHVTSLSMDTSITETLDSSKIRNHQNEDDYLTPPTPAKSYESPPPTGQAIIPSNTQFYDPTVRINKICGVYVEVSNSLYKYWGSNSTTVTNNVNTILSNVIAIYDREGITVRLNKIYIWDTTDPYAGNNGSDLQTFTTNINQNSPTTPNAEFKHLLVNSPGQGGLAWINGFSDGYTTSPSIPLYYACAVSAVISGSLINSNTTYSWPVYVVAHEMGHNLGSRHTQFCGWRDDNGNLIGRLDSCYGGESSSTAPNCTGNSNNITRSNTKGAIMSYCHINGSVSFLTGFGKYSRFALRSNLYGTTTIPFSSASLPIVTTSPPTFITVTSATFGGTVVADGGGAVSQRGVIWSTSQNPTTALSTKVTSGTGIGSFSSSVTSLIPGTTYYVRAYAINVVGTSYGQQETFTTPSYSAPVITTNTIAAITQTSSTSGGNITSAGFSTITARGVCWSTIQNPTIADTKTSNGTASGNVSALITGLTASTTYYVRSYVTYTNPLSSGTVYGNQLSFTTLASTQASVATTSISSIGTTSATSGGTIFSDGGSAITAKGVVWSTLPSPTILLSTKTNNGTGTATFTSTISGLTSGLTYYVRSYVTNATSTYYGNELTFTTVVLPSITMTSVSSIESTKADFNFTVNKAPTGLNTTGVLVSTINPPTYANRSNFYFSNFINEGPSTLTGFGLTANTTYYCKAYMASDLGQEYYSANTVTFSTNSVVGTPTVLTVSVSSTTSTITLSGNLTDNGTSAATKGFCWSTSPNPTISLPSYLQRSAGFGLGQYTATITGLNSNTIYYVRAYATNASGTAYGDEISVVTGGSLATLTTTSVSSIATTTASSGGNITNAGSGGVVTNRGVVWSTLPSPTISLSTKTSDGTGTGSFTSSITGLSQNTTYYVRAYATTSQGTEYGNQVSFRTLVASTSPIVVTTAISGISSTAATSGGTITSDGGLSVTAKGVCWSTTQNPTTSNSFTSNGTGTSSFSSALAGLSPATTYYVRAYATNASGTSYGSNVSFTTTSSTATLSTSSISGLTSTSATSGGNITNSGGSTITSRGVVWSTSANPTISLSTKTSNGTGTGIFVSSLTSLTASTTYYVRSYATNSAGTAYGNQVTFTTSASGGGGNCLVTNFQVTKVNNKWNFRFNINPNCNNYTVNVCRYSNANPSVPPTVGQSPVACAVRNKMSNYVPTASEISAGFITREMNPQPANLNQWYSVDVKCNSASCSGSSTTRSAYFYNP